MGEKVHIGRLVRVNWDLVMKTKEVKIEFLEKIVEFKPEPSQLDNLHCSLTSELSALKYYQTVIEFHCELKPKR